MSAKRLDQYLADVEDTILARQDANTGLLPASTAITVHGDYTHAWVRDNVYSILAVWALGRAYRRVDQDIADRLDGNVVRLMRGLLAAMMRQANKVERFKVTQNPLDALHAKYDTRTGEPVVGDSEWGHLQLDATAIFVLFLAQMSASGLKIVLAPEEVCFVQNLVHYLAKAFRTPDFGIWERGHKRNEGVAEINASSVGMAKAALEAIDGFHFLADRGPAIHVQADDIAHARNTLESLLPRESVSKETDAALLSVIGYPAFAVEDEALRARTRAEIIDKLKGRYGCKRFLRDGHQTVLEDHARQYYEAGELGQFEHIESEWPLFFSYLLVDAVMRGDFAEAADYRARLDGLMVERDGQKLLPELYFVPAESVDAEREAPHSQERVPNENVPLVWAQSLFVLGALMQEGYLDAADLDPLGRRSASPRRNDAVSLRIVLLAEDRLMQARLAAQGIAAETREEVSPVQVRFAQDLRAGFAELGRCETLGLSGRPADPVGTLTTSRAFTLGSETFVFLPSFFNRPGFYLRMDNRLLIEEVNAEAAYIRHHWNEPGQPLLVFLLEAPMLDANGADVLMAILQQLTQGKIDGMRADTLARSLSDTGRSPIDWLDRLPVSTAAPPGPELNAVLSWEEAATRPLTAEKAAALERTTDESLLLAQLATSCNPYEQVEIVGLLAQRRGGDYAIAAGGSVRQLAGAIYAQACRHRLWGVMRRAAGLLDLYDETLEDAVEQIVVRRKRLSVGRTDPVDAIISEPHRNADIMARIRAHGGEDVRGRALIQEIVLLLAILIKAEPELFKGTLTLRAWHLVMLINGWLEREHGVTSAEAFDHLLDLSPNAILGRLREVIAREREMTDKLLKQRLLACSVRGAELVPASFDADADPVLRDRDGGWKAWREMSGVMTRLPEDFHSRVWELLGHCSGLVIGNPLDSRNAIESRIAGADSTPAEQGFALLVDDLLNKITEPAYRQLTIEALLAASEVCRATKDLRIDGQLVIDVLLETAVNLSWQEHLEPASPPGSHRKGELGGSDLDNAWLLFMTSEPHRVANHVSAAFLLLLGDAPAAPDGK